MGLLEKLLIASILVAIGLVLLLFFKNSLTRGVGGKILAFIVLFLHMILHHYGNRDIPGFRMVRKVQSCPVYFLNSIRIHV